MLAVMAALIAAGWYLIESRGIWLIVAAAVVGVISVKARAKT